MEHCHWCIVLHFTGVGLKACYQKNLVITKYSNASKYSNSTSKIATAVRTVLEYIYLVSFHHYKITVKDFHRLSCSCHLLKRTWAFEGNYHICSDTWRQHVKNSWRSTSLRAASWTAGWSHPALHFSCRAGKGFRGSVLTLYDNSYWAGQCPESGTEGKWKTVCPKRVTPSWTRLSGCGCSMTR